MPAIVFDKQNATFSTPIPDEFILKHLPTASGTYVKVYLYIFYHHFNSVPDFTLAKAAEALSLLESDVLEALNYWHKKGMLILTRTKDCCTIRFVQTSAPPTPQPPKKKVPQESAETAKVVRVEHKPVYSPQEMALYKKTPQVKQLFAAAEKFLGGALSFPNLSLLYSFYDYYRLPIDVIEYLMEYCAETGNTNLRYMEKIVQDWTDKGITTLEAAQNQVGFFRNYYPIMKSLGVGGRRPTDTERKFMDCWLQEWQMPSELLTEAAARTIERTGKPSFQYMNTILKNWFDRQLLTLQDVKGSDSTYNNNRVPAAGGQRSGTFHTYMSSGTDYDSIGEMAHRQLFAEEEM